MSGRDREMNTARMTDESASEDADVATDGKESQNEPLSGSDADASGDGSSSSESSISFEDGLPSVKGARGLGPADLLKAAVELKLQDSLAQQWGWMEAAPGEEGVSEDGLSETLEDEIATHTWRQAVKQRYVCMPVSE